MFILMGTRGLKDVSWEGFFSQPRFQVERTESIKRQDGVGHRPGDAKYFEVIATRCPTLGFSNKAAAIEM